MQHPTLQIRDRLLAGLDREYNVIDMGVVIEVLAQLENIPITKEALEISRLGKHINELRRKASDRLLANRAKSLVKKWRQLLVVSSTATGEHTNHHLTNGNANGQTQSKPSSRLTSPMLDVLSNNSKYNNVGLSPGIKPAGGISSLPSSASTSPGLPVSRPSTPVAPALAGHQPVSPYLRGQPTATINHKRTLQQRCDDDSPVIKNGPSKEPDAKRPRLNGNTGDHLIEEDSVSSDMFSSSMPAIVSNEPSAPLIVSEASDATPAKPGKKKARMSRVKAEAEDSLKQRMASVLKSSGKVRTTQELVQEMALRSHSPGILPSTPVSKSSMPVTATSPNHLNEETKSELMNRFLESQAEASSPPEPSLRSEERVPSSGNETVEDILARLPIIDASCVLSQYESSEEEDLEDVEGLIPVIKPPPDTGPEILSELHDGQKESFNGNFDHEGQFREWFEVVTKRTKDDELLYVLPYSVIE